jgi:uncharacterized membrane protein YkoI
MLKILSLIGLTMAPTALAAADGCLSSDQARLSVQAERLIEMPEAAQLARGKAGGEVVSANLCRVNQRLMYVIAILSRDGRVARVSVDAKTRSVSDFR